MPDCIASTAFLSPFNPSGTEPDDPVIVADIGDQNRGHYLLVEKIDPEIVAGLRAHVAAMNGGNHALDQVAVGPRGWRRICAADCASCPTITTDATIAAMAAPGAPSRGTSAASRAT